MPDANDRVACRTPSPGRDGVTNLPRWKYDAVRHAIIDAIHATGNGTIVFAALPEAVARHLPEDVAGRLGSVGWHTTTVKLNMEVEGELVRLDGSPQRLRLAPGVK